MEQKLKEVFANALEIDISQVSNELAYQSVDTWDSIGHMALVAAIDSAFAIMLDTEDVIALSSFAKAKDILKKYEIHAS